MAGKRRGWKMVQKDLERVGVPYQNEDGITDFHAAGRHTRITELLRNGASLPEAKARARHSSVSMTMKYVHLGMNDQAKALKSLPAPSESWQDIGRKPGVFDGRKRSPAGTKRRNAQRAKRSKSPDKNGASGGSEQSVSASDTDAPKVEAAGIEPAY